MLLSAHDLLVRARLRHRWRLTVTKQSLDARLRQAYLELQSGPMETEAGHSSPQGDTEVHRSAPHLRVVLADDEPLALERLSLLFQEIPGTEVVGCANNGLEALDIVDLLHPDLLLLDVQMPDLDGIAVAMALQGRSTKPEIIFATAFDRYAAEAFELEAADYLLKPVLPDRLWQAIARAKRRRYLETIAGHSFAEAATGAGALQQPAPETGFWIKSNGSARHVSMSSIDWIEAQRDYVILHTATRSHIMRTSMRSLEEQLQGADLMRVHRSAFARPSNVIEIKVTGKTIRALILRDGAVVKVGRHYSPDVARRLGIGA